MTKDISITEYHLCGECKQFLTIPSAWDSSNDVSCLKSRPEFNKEGGLSDCPVYEDH